MPSLKIATLFLGLQNPRDYWCRFPTLRILELAGLRIGWMYCCRQLPTFSSKNVTDLAVDNLVGCSPYFQGLVNRRLPLIFGFWCQFMLIIRLVRDYSIRLQN